jgi:hypothetical protein
MTPTRVFLLLSALVWLPYGLYCLADPGSLAATAGIVAQSATATTELRAMYGGLQAALGVLALIGAFAGGLRRPALLTIAFLTAGLGSTRLLGVVVDGGLSGYTAAGVTFEVLSASLATWLLQNSSSPATAR